MYSDGILLNTVTQSVHCTVSNTYDQVHIRSFS